MGLADIGRILEQYSGMSSGRPPGEISQDFDHIAQQAPAEHLRSGLTEAFRSDQTPPFGHMVAQLFEQADPEQRSGMLNHMLGSVGPSVLGSLLGGGALGGLFQHAPDQPVQVTPEQARQISPDQVRDLASHAERENPGIVEKMSDFYAQNPTLIKALGGAALAVMLGKMTQRNS